MLSPPSLFENKKEFLIVSALLSLIIAIRVLFLYQDYKSLKSTPNYYYSVAQILKLFQKKDLTLIKVRSIDNFEFYIATNKRVEPFEWVRVKFKLKESTTFLEYLKSPFINGEVLEHIEEGFDAKWYLKDKISKEHKNREIALFYNAIFLAQPLNRELREKISSLGISHLVALSGFHLGILWIVILFVLYTPYRFFHQKYYPYRHKDIDLGLIILILLALFILFVGSPPSLIRAYVMALLGWIVLILGLELISFKLLVFTALLILALFPKLIVSFGFILSVAGVFYIFLILRWLRDASSWFIKLIAIPIGVFVFMFPIAHYLFPTTSIYQLFSPILSILFVPFYPISAILHIFGYGSAFDGFLLWLFNLPIKSKDIVIPTYLIVLYLLLSFGSIFSKTLFVLTFLLALTITTFSLILF